MAGHLVSAAVSRFHTGEGTYVKLVHFWSQGPLVNGVRSWQLIIKHDLTHRLHGWTLCVHPSVRVPHCYGTGPLLEPGSTCEWCQKVAFEYNIKPDFTHLSYPDTCCPPQSPGSRSVTLCVHPSVRVPHCFGTGPLLDPGSTCEWCQKMAFEYNIKPDFTHLSYPDTWCPPQSPGSRSVMAPMLNRPTSGVRVHL